MNWLDEGAMNDLENHDAHSDSSVSIKNYFRIFQFFKIIFYSKLSVHSDRENNFWFKWFEEMENLCLKW